MIWGTEHESGFNIWYGCRGNGTGGLAHSPELIWPGGGPGGGKDSVDEWTIT